MRLDQVPSVVKGKRKNPDPRMNQEAAMALIPVPHICRPQDCHFCKLDVAHASHITTLDYESMMAEPKLIRG
jgi:hypothetical protein